jgi:hypothetical protein
MTNSVGEACFDSEDAGLRISSRIRSRTNTLGEPDWGGKSKTQTDVLSCEINFAGDGKSSEIP